MKRGHLSEYFEGVGVKTLSVVDATPSRSHQHEIGTTAAMRRFLGNEKQTFPTTYLWLGGEQESITAEGISTHYDAREKQPKRSPEWRLYYDDNAVTKAMRAGETLFLAKRPKGSLLLIVTPAESTIQNQLLWLFGFNAQPQLKFAVNEIAGDEDAILDFAARRILDEIGVEFEDPNANDLDEIIDRFGTTFPKTVEFSDLARLTLPHVNAADDPDGALVAWLDHEEAMFRRLEHRAMTERLAEGFGSGRKLDVEGFMDFSLSVQNRRKSRMGLALENHLEAVFRAFSLKYQRQAATEQKNTVDFLFPGPLQYHDLDWPDDLLTMLAAKATCKDRWRQVLAEAGRIPQKHLITLEPAISPAQTEQMQASDLQLIVPKRIHGSYQRSQTAWLWSLSDFIQFVGKRQEMWTERPNWLPWVSFLEGLNLTGLDLTREPDFGRDIDR